MSTHFTFTRLPFGIRRAASGLVGAVPVRIRSGPNAGLKWSLASSGRGYRDGTFEAARVAAITSLLRPGDRFWDVGAHKGYVTMAAARAVGPGGVVLAFEPAADNRACLGRHLSWNRLENVRVFPVALCDVDGEAPFGGTGSSIAYRLGQGDSVTRTRTIRALIEQDRLLPPAVLKIDAEGSEAAVLRAGLDVLPSDTLIWISLHGRELYSECRSLLEGHGYRVVESASLQACLRDPDGQWGGDHELLAIGSERDIPEDRLQSLALFRGEK